MGHHHEHGEENAQIPFHEKAKKLIDHWIKHNDDHAADYRRWAEAFRNHAMNKAADALESAAEQNERINAALIRAKKDIPHSH